MPNLQRFCCRVCGVTLTVTDNGIRHTCNLALIEWVRQEAQRVVDEQRFDDYLYEVGRWNRELIQGNGVSA
jgi:hypothetical protein